MSGLQIPGFTPFGTNGLSSGWSHTFDVRLIPSTTFDPTGGTTVMGLVLWDGSLEVWEGSDETHFWPRHNEYRGELTVVTSGSTGIVEWVTPDRLKYRFRTPRAGGVAMRGRLLEIQDLNSPANSVTLNWDQTFGRLLSVTDSAGAQCQFNYNAQAQLTSVSYLGWTGTFTYNAAAGNRLATIATTGPAAYAPLPTTWGFFYRSSTDTATGLLEKIAGPRGQSSNPVFYDTTVTYDEYGRVKQQTDALGRNQFTKYNVPAKRQLTHTDALSKDTLETFDRKSHVTGRKDPLGNTITFEYDLAGNVAASVDANTNRTEFTYDTRANVLTKKVVALNETTTWEYNAIAGSGTNAVALNKPTKQTDPPASHNGQPAASWVTNYEYDSGGNLLHQYDAIGDLVTNTYNTRGQLFTTKDARNFVSSFTYKPEGFLATKTVPDVGGATRTWTYDYTELGWLKTETNPLSLTTYFYQNINGQIVTIVDPLGRDFQKTYDASGNLLTDADGLHIATTYTYDAANQRMTMLTRDSKTWNYGYTLRGEPQFIRDPSLTAPTNTVTYEYDDAGRRTKETDALGFFSQIFYDANGNLTKTTDKEAKDWTKKYDALNRVTESTDPEGDKTTTTYDHAGRIDTVTNPRGYVSLHEYDGRNRLSKWTDPGGFLWRYLYDGNGNITDIEDALHGHYVMTYGPRNERFTELNQDSKQWSYTYDPLLRLATQTDPNAIVRTLHYDDGGRVESMDFSTGRQAVFFYDDNNNPLNIRRVVPGQSTTQLTLTYDSMDRVLSSRDTFGKTVGYTYDAAGRVKTKVYPGSKTLTQNYDSAGRLTGLSDWASRNSAFTYDKVGRLKTHLFPNGITAAIGYDTAGHLTSLDQGPTANPQQIALRYAYDRNGNKTSETKKGVLDWQPNSVVGGTVAPFDESYTPTAAGRLVSSTDALNSTRNFTYTYDESGNMTAAASAGTTYGFTYDEDNRVATVASTTGTTTTNITNRYDPLGRRLSRTLNGSESRYILDLTGDMERILADTDVTGNVLTRYIHGPGGLGYKEDAATSAITCYHADAMGNILRLTDATGTAVADYTYNPYGRVLATTGTASNPYRFVGSQGVMEELPNLYFMRARYYSAEAGIFLSTDPVKNIGPRWRPEAYQYAGGNPMASSDPDGRMTVELEGYRFIENWAAGYFIEAARDRDGLLGYVSSETQDKVVAGMEAGDAVLGGLELLATAVDTPTGAVTAASLGKGAAGFTVDAYEERAGSSSYKFVKSTLNSIDKNVLAPIGSYLNQMFVAPNQSSGASTKSIQSSAKTATNYGTTLNSVQARTGAQLQAAPQPAATNTASASASTTNGGTSFSSLSVQQQSSLISSLQKLVNALQSYVSSLQKSTGKK